MTLRIDPKLIPINPTLEFEDTLVFNGIKLVAGIDEAGRGALAGPVCAAAVVLPINPGTITTLAGVRDSKQMSSKQRQIKSVVIKKVALGWAVGFASSIEIDKFGIVPATRIAMQRAMQALALKPEHILIDAMLLPENSVPQTSLIKGDSRSLSIAAASVLAKVARDEWITAKDKQYPSYKLANNKGYGTLAHRNAISKIGPSPIHRLSFAPMRHN